MTGSWVSIRRVLAASAAALVAFALLDASAGATLVSAGKVSQSKPDPKGDPKGDDKDDPKGDDDDDDDDPKTTCDEYVPSDLSLSVTIARPGQSVVVSGTAFPGDTVLITIARVGGGAPSPLGSATAFANGYFATTVTLPATLIPGTYRISVASPNCPRSSSVTLVVRNRGGHCRGTTHLLARRGDRVTYTLKGDVDRTQPITVQLDPRRPGANIVVYSGPYPRTGKIAFVVPDSARNGRYVIQEDGVDDKGVPVSNRCGHLVVRGRKPNGGGGGGSTTTTDPKATTTTVDPKDTTTTTDPKVTTTTESKDTTTTTAAPTSTTTSSSTTSTTSTTSTSEATTSTTSTTSTTAPPTTSTSTTVKVEGTTTTTTKVDVKGVEVSRTVNQVGSSASVLGNETGRGASLATTGSTTRPVLVAAVALLASGAVLLLSARKRRARRRH